MLHPLAAVAALAPQVPAQSSSDQSLLGCVRSLALPSDGSRRLLCSARSSEKHKDHLSSHRPSPCGPIPLWPPDAGEECQWPAVIESEPDRRLLAIRQSLVF